jgi:urease accessory protein
MMSELTLLLADGRWPGGGYAHSGSLEAALRAGLVRDAETLRLFVVGRLNTAGPFEAWLAGRSCVGESVDHLNLRFEARTPSAAQRLSSASLGRGLIRASARIWPELRTLTTAYQPVAVGAVARVAGLGALDAARIAVHNVVMGPITAAPKLLAIDTSDALRIVVAISALIDDCSIRWSAELPPPARSALSAELLAEEHATWSTRLFAS